MRDIDDTIAVQRLFALRQQPGFQDADLGELATLAENLVETQYPAGAVVADPASRVAALHLVIDGELTGQARTHWGPRDVFGELEVLAGRALEAPVIATTTTRTYQLASQDLVEVLEDNFGLLTTTRRGIARNLLELAPAAMRSGMRHLTTQAPAELGLVDRLLVLRQHFPLATLAPLAALAQATVEMRFAPGEVIRAAGDRASGILVLLEGVVRSGAEVGVPNDAIGFYELLAERPHIATTEAASPVRVLHIPEVALVDIMEDHAELGLAILGLLAGELLDALARSAESN